MNLFFKFSFFLSLESASDRSAIDCYMYIYPGNSQLSMKTDLTAIRRCDAIK